MADDPFDLEKVRKAWAREPARRSREHHKFAAVEAAVDPAEQATQVAAGLRALCRLKLGGQLDVLDPILDEIDELLLEITQPPVVESAPEEEPG